MAWFLIALFIVASIGIFFAYVDASMNGKTDLRIGPDSTFYLWYAGLIGDNPYGANSDPTFAIISIGSNYLGPVLIAKALRYNFAILCFNYVLFFLAIWYLTNAITVRTWALTALLLVNPLVSVSILTLNKEILAVVSTAMLYYYVSAGRRSRTLLLSILVVSLLTRWQHMLAVSLFLLITAEWSPLRNRRTLTICLIVAAITIIYPTISAIVTLLAFGSDELQGNTIATLTALQNRYLYFVVAIPKIALNLFGGALHRSDYGNEDVFNTFIVPIGSAINFLVAGWFLALQRLRIRDDMVFFAILYAVLFTVSPYAQVRFLLPVYVVLCCGVARRRNISSEFSEGGAAGQRLPPLAVPQPR